MRNDKINRDIFESLMDDITIEDLNNHQNAVGKLSNDANADSEGEYTIYLHTDRNLITIYHGDGQLFDIGSYILDTTRIVKNCSIWCTPKIKHSDEGEVSDINIMDEDAVKKVNNTSSFFAQNLRMSFDLDNSKRSDISYMIKAIAEAFMTFDKIIRLCNPDKIKARSEKIIIQTIPCTDPTTWSNGWLSSSEYYRLANIGELKDNAWDQLLGTLNMFSTRTFDYDDLITYFDGVRKCSLSMFNEMTEHGADTRITQRIKLVNEISDNSVEIIIPQDVSTSLLKLNPESIARSYGAKGGVRININGNLIIKDLEDFENVKYINPLFSHNQLTIRCTLNAKMLHYILTHLSFRTIDVSKAKIWKNDRIVIDMSSPKLKNPGVNIIGNENIIVTSK